MEYIKNERKKLGLTQAAVARGSGISRQMYGFIEKGVRRPSVDVAKKIAEVLGIEWTRFYE